MNIKLSEESAKILLDALEYAKAGAKADAEDLPEGEEERERFISAAAAAEALFCEVQAQVDAQKTDPANQSPALTHVAIKVEGGIVQAVFANGPVDVEVYDLDVSDFPSDDSEVAAAEQRAEELDAIANNPNYGVAW